MRYAYVFRNGGLTARSVSQVISHMSESAVEYARLLLAWLTTPFPNMIA